MVERRTMKRKPLIQLYTAIGEMLKKVGLTDKEISREVFNGTYYPSSKNQNSVMSAAKVAAMAEYCGYELCLVPEESVPRNAITISSDQSIPKKDDGIRLGEGIPFTESEDMIG